MPFRAKRSMLICGLVLGGLSTSAVAQLPPPTPPPPPTLWSFLGIPQGYRYVRDNGFNRNGNRPGLERKPPLKAIADPKNLESKDLAIKKAAEVKQAEDLKKQKIKAIKYLASIGCGCYNRDGSITDAMLKSMDDCTEEVRLATVQAISEAAMGERCANCKQKSCCSEELSNKLYEIAYGRDETGCYLEPSERVRLAAAEAMRTCCESRGDDMMFMEPGPGPTPATGGEQPNIGPEVGGERPGDLPPVIIPTPPAAVPLQNPAPLGAPPAPAPAAAKGVPSSRRQAMTPSRPGSAQHQTEATVVANPQPESTEPVRNSRPSSSISPVVIAPPVDQSVRVNPHWKPADEQQSVFFRASATGPLPIEDPDVKPTPNNVVVTSLPPRKGVVAQPARLDATLGLAPIVTRASLTRLPPVEHQQQSVGAASHNMPVPPLPSTSAVISPVSMTRPRSANVDSAGDNAPASVLINHENLLPAAPLPAKNKTSMRQLPGSQFGTGVISSVRMKDGMAVVEFDTQAAVPPGSIIRAYHYYALTGKKPVCDLQVVDSAEGRAIAVVNGKSQLTNLAVGDQAVVLQ